MLSGIDALNPIEFLYEHDTNLIINQKNFITQQGLQLNLVNGLSSCRDETILNYSNIFLTDKQPVNDFIHIKPKEDVGLTFPTYLALSALPTLPQSVQSLYIRLSSSPTINLSSAVSFTPALSNSLDSYFSFQGFQGLRCRISILDQGYTKNLTVDPVTYNCYFSSETPKISSERLNIFEYSLDPNGYLKLFYRQGSNFYLLRQIGNALSAVPVLINSSGVTNYPSVTGDIIATSYRLSDPLKFKNNFIYYNKDEINDFIVEDSRSIVNVPQNRILYYNYESDVNFVSGSKVLVDFYQNKNVLSDDYSINDKLPFGNKYVIQRDYTTILSKQNSELYNGQFQLNYNYYTKEYTFEPDLTTKFTLPATLYPYSSLNVDNSNLVNEGSYGGLSPVFSDKVFKHLDPNSNVVNKNEANGTYLYTWLYTDSKLLTSYWLDRYYFPKLTSVNVAYSGSNNQIFNYTSGLSSLLQANSPDNPILNSNKLMYYDIRSSLTFEPSASYFYSRIGKNYINKVVDTFTKSVSSLFVYDQKNVVQEENTSLEFNNNGYGVFKIPSDSNQLSISFDLNAANKNNIKSNLLLGNNFDEGINLYKGGVENMFTPGFLINTLSGVDFYDINNKKVFSLIASDYINAPVKILDIVNYGFDHIIKLFYLNLQTNCPGFIDFSIYNRVFNYYEFSDLKNIFNQTNNNILFAKAYNNTNEVWYYTNPQQGMGKIHNFDYINNTYNGVVLNTGFFVGTTVNSFVNTNSTANGIYLLSGFNGLILDQDIGVSKLRDTVYFRTLSSGAPQVPVLSTLGGSIFDINVHDDRLYVLTNGQVTSYDKYKRVYNSYYLNTDTASGIKIDFINDNYNTKLLTYTADLSGKLIVSKFDIETSAKESTFDTNVTVIPQMFGEYNTPKKATYTGLVGIGVINNSFVSGGIENNYTYNNPIFSTLTAVNMNAYLAGTSDDCGDNSKLTGKLKLLGNSRVPSDVWLSIVRADIGTSVASISGNNVLTEIEVTYNSPIQGVPYGLLATREVNDNLGIEMQLDISKGSFYNGSFRNFIVGSQYISPTSPGFASALYTINATDLFPQNYFISNAQAYALTPTYNLVTFFDKLSTTSFNGITINPYVNFFANGKSPYLSLVANPDPTTTSSFTSGFSACVIEYTTSTPVYGTTLSGSPFQVPTNFYNINSINKLDQGDVILRADLFSGVDTQSKQTVIETFNIENSSNIVITMDFVNNNIRSYVNSKLVKDIQLDQDLVFSSYFLQNNFGVGMPYINNKAASTLDIDYNDFAQNYVLNNFAVYNKSLNPDEIKFNYLKDKVIDSLNFDIPQGTRNNTDTATSFNKLIIPGRKNNNVKLYIKNLNLNDAGKAQLSSQLLGKLKDILPITISNIEIKYIDNE
jgi:hypothetical protein